MKTDSEEIIFCRNVVYLRKKYGLSQKDMANKLNIGVATLRSLEQGIIPRRMKVDVFWYIYKNFNISIHRQFENLSIVDESK